MTRNYVLTHVRSVIDEYDFFEQMRRGAVQDGVHGSQEDGPGLVVEADDHARRRKIRKEAIGSFTPGKKTC